jgi:hypothetical protein
MNYYIEGKVVTVVRHISTEGYNLLIKLGYSVRFKC